VNRCAWVTLGDPLYVAYHAFEAALAEPSGAGPVGPASGSTVGGTVAV